MSAQLTVTNAPPYNSPQYLIENVLLGSGVIASNFTFTGNQAQIGFFDGSASIIGLDSGVVIFTGAISGLQPGDTTNSNMNNNSDTDLFNVANSVPPLIGQSFYVTGTYDAAVLEFDFIPTGDTVKFRYVFGSNEYQTYINTKYNDAFGFFISGPGITGTYSNNAENIAVIPNTNPPLPVTVSSIQPNLNGQYYIDNPLNSTIQLNGFTTVLTASSSVSCGQTYHIKLAIADGSDQWLDSGVFLEASSFSSGTVNVSASTSYSTANGDTMLYEGCGVVTLTFTRAGNIAQEDTIYSSISGTASNGIDYSFIPDTLYFAAGQSVITLTFTPVDDGVSEGPETIQIDILPDSVVCGVTGGGIILTVYDPIPLTITTNNDTMLCTDDSILISVNVNNGVPAFQYQWSTNDTTNAIFVSPIATTDYYISVTDGCGMQTDIDTITVFVLVPPILLSASDTFAECPEDTVLLSVSVSGGQPPYQYWWNNNIADTIQTVIPDTTTTYTFYIFDQCGTDTDSVSITVSLPSFAAIVVSIGQGDTLLCPGDSIEYIASAIGGDGNYQFSWDGWATLSDSLAVNPPQTTTYTVEATDGCANDTAYNSVTVVVLSYAPIIAIAPVDTNAVCPGNIVELSVMATGGTGNYTYTWNDFIGNTDSVSVYPEMTTTYMVLVEDECENKDSAQVKVTVNIPADATFTHEADDCTGEVAFNSPALQNVTYYWNFGDGTKSTLSNPVHTYSSDGEYEITLILNKETSCADTAIQTLTNLPALSDFYVPTIFTPNGDGNNDMLFVQGTANNKFQFAIYDRWGMKVFETTDKSIGWNGANNGKIMNTAVFVYFMEVTCPNGNTSKRKGNISLIR